MVVFLSGLMKSGGDDVKVVKMTFENKKNVNEMEEDLERTFKGSILVILGVVVAFVMYPVLSFAFDWDGPYLIFLVMFIGIGTILIVIGALLIGIRSMQSPKYGYNASKAAYVYYPVPYYYPYYYPYYPYYQWPYPPHQSEPDKNKTNSD